MIEDFNIRDSDQNPFYSYHSSYTNTLLEVADSFGLDLSILINPGSTQFLDNSQDLNLVLDLMFLRTVLEEFNNHLISLDF